MSSASVSAKAAMRRLADEAKALVENESLSAETKRAGLDKIEAEFKKYEDEIKTFDATRFLAIGGNSASVADDIRDISGVLAGSSPSLVLAPDQQEALYKSAKDRLPITVKTAVTDANVPMANVPMRYLPPVLAAREPTRILDVLPSSGTGAASVQYYVTTGTAAAAATAEGSAKPQSSLSFTAETLTHTKIAHYVTVTEEALTDFQPFSQLLSDDMVHGLIDAENRVLLSATGTAPETFKGLLEVTGTQSYTQAASPETALDAIEIAAANLRAGGRFVSPDAVVMHPLDYSAIRRTKDSAGRYVADQMSFGVEAPVTHGQPFLWNLPVILTSEIPQKTVLVGNFARAAMVWVREAVSIRTDPYSLAINNEINFICEERLALGVVAPAALSIVTLT